MATETTKVIADSKNALGHDRADSGLVFGVVRSMANMLLCASLLRVVSLTLCLHAVLDASQQGVKRSPWRNKAGQ